MSFVNVYHFCVRPSFLFGFEGVMWDVIVLIPIIAFLFTVQGSCSHQI